MALDQGARDLMFSFESIAQHRAVNRAKQLHAMGDPAGARDVMAAFVERHPKSQRGWVYLLWTLSEAGGSIEDRLDVLRRASEAVPYDQTLVDATVGHLMRAALMIGEHRYLEDARRVVDRFEELLGPSVESLLLRAGLEQLNADEARTLRLCNEVEDMLRVHPDPRATLKLGLCLASVKGHEERGKKMAEEAAAKLKDCAAYAYLAAIEERENPARADRYISEARRLGSHGSLPEGYLENLIAQAREDIRLEKEFLENV